MSVPRNTPESQPNPLLLYSLNALMLASALLIPGTFWLPELSCMQTRSLGYALVACMFVSLLVGSSAWFNYPEPKYPDISIPADFVPWAFTSAGRQRRRQLATLVAVAAAALLVSGVLYFCLGERLRECKQQIHVVTEP